MQPVQDLTVEDRVSRTQYQYSLEDADAEELQRLGAASWSSELRDAARSCATSAATSRTSGLQATLAHRPRHGVAARHHAADDRRHALRRLRPAAGLDDLHAAEPVPRRAGGRRRTSRRSPTALDSIYVARADRRRRCRSSAFTHVERDDGAAGDQSPGTVPGGDAVVQPGARRVARRGGATRSRRRRARSACRPSIRGELPGHGAGVPGLARQRAAADPGRAGHRLHRARRALRELHPPDHDPLDAALGRRRRASWRCCSAAPSSA